MTETAGVRKQTLLTADFRISWTEARNMKLGRIDVDVGVGSKTEVAALERHVRSTLHNRPPQAAPPCPFRAKPGHRVFPFDHLVGTKQQRRRTSPAKAAITVSISLSGARNERDAAD
jgi:hypothetical protein